LPIFNGDEDNIDKWEIQWKALAEVDNIVSNLGKALIANIPAFVKTDKETKAAFKANH